MNTLDKPIKKAAQRAGLFEVFQKYNECVMLEAFNDNPKPERVAYIQTMDRAVGMLSEIEQQLLRKRYMNPEMDYTTDQSVYIELQISETKYDKIRKNAFARLKTLLGELENHKK